MPATSDPSEACIREIREALKTRDPDIQVVLDGILVYEVLEAGNADPVLRVTRVGDPSSWALIGMLRAATRLAEVDLMDGWEADDDE